MLVHRAHKMIVSWEETFWQQTLLYIRYRLGNWWTKKL